MTDERRVGRHKLTVDQRESVVVTGVLDVVSFDEDKVICETDMGVLVMRGANLNVSSLNLEAGSLALTGKIFSLVYEAAGQQKGKKGAVFGKIFK